MAELPYDIIKDIFLRLPTKSLVRFRCVCKAWHSLITSHDFIRLHLDHATDDKYHEHPQKVILSHSQYSIRCLQYGAPSDCKVVSFDFPLNNRKGFKVVGSCNGLLCVVIYDHSIILWNPSTREYRTLPDPPSVGFKEGLYGFGYDSSIDDYKVVRVCSKNKWAGILEDDPVEIYSLKTNSWKKIRHISFSFDFCRGLAPGMLVNGALYWLVFAPTSMYGAPLHILCRNTVLRFDLMDEKFTVVPPLHELAKEKICRLEVYGGRLCRVEYHLGMGGIIFEIWALKEDNSMKQVWTKLMTIPSDHGLKKYFINGSLNPICSFNPICFMKNGEVLMNIKGTDGNLLYNQERKTLKEFSVRGTLYCSLDGRTPYVESLVSPNEDVKAKRSKKRRKLSSAS